MSAAEAVDIGSGVHDDIGDGRFGDDVLGFTADDDGIHFRGLVPGVALGVTDDTGGDLRIESPLVLSSMRWL